MNLSGAQSFFDLHTDQATRRQGQLLLGIIRALVTAQGDPKLYLLNEGWIEIPLHVPVLATARDFLYRHACATQPNKSASMRWLGVRPASFYAHARALNLIPKRNSTPAKA